MNAKIVIALIVLVMSACGSAPMRYEPKPSDMTVEQAMDTVEKLTMMQHQAWKPDYIGFERDYIVWDNGRVTTSRSSAVAVPVGNIAIGVGRGRETTRNVGTRIYFSDIQKVELLSWKRKMQQWYVVSIVAFRGQRTHVLRTRYQEDSEKYVDALHVLIEARRSTSGTAR